MNKIYVVGIGPGGLEYLTPQASEAIKQSTVIVGYTYYLGLIKDLTVGKEQISTGMKKERDRALEAFEIAQKGNIVSVISSGDSGVYGMASLIYDMKEQMDFDIEIEVVPGISAMMGAAAKLGAPLGHDFCSVSMSDLLTPWEVIEKRTLAAAMGDFVTAIYNPVSKGRFWQLMRLKEIFLQHRDPNTPVGIARQVGRDEESIRLTTLEKLDANEIDMFTVVIIGNSQTRNSNGHMLTPRGYYSKSKENKKEPGRSIMRESFRQIMELIEDKNVSKETLWAGMHCIHTTADTEIIKSLKLSDKVLENAHKAFYSGKPPVIITDVNMVKSGIRKGLLEKLGIKVICYLNDERADKLAIEKNITRTQAGMRIAAEEYPNALYAIGNAPTALIEIVKLTRKGIANPMAIIGAPVGFVNVKESKWQLKHGCPDTPHVIVDGRKGGSNIAATIVNSMLSWEDAKDINPGEGMLL